MTREALLLFIAAGLWLTGCTSQSQTTAPKPIPAAKVSAPVKEAELTTVTLTPEAEQRLGIATVAIEKKLVREERQVAGELMLAGGRTWLVPAPLGGVLKPAPDGVPQVGGLVKAGQLLFTLTPQLGLQRDLRITYESDVAAAKARFEAAQSQLERAKQLLRDEAGSRRNVEAAESELGQSKALYDSARDRLKRLIDQPLDADLSVNVNAPVSGMLRQVLAAPGMTVAGGANLVEIVDYGKLWLRVPVYVGDLASLAGAGSVKACSFESTGRGPCVNARRVAAPPTADPLAAAGDLYFEVDNSAGGLRPGEKLAVSLPLKAQGEALVAPLGSVLYDANGGAWLYVKTGDHKYTRRHIEIARVLDGMAVLAKGPAAGSLSVTAGSAELFGTEFGAGK